MLASHELGLLLCIVLFAAVFAAAEWDFRKV